MPGTPTSPSPGGGTSRPPQRNPGTSQPSASSAPDAEVDWRGMLARLAPLRRRWDLAVLANLAAGPERPGGLIAAINAQADGGRQISWKVAEDALRRLERNGYIAHREVSRFPRETRYWLLPPGDRLVHALNLLTTWYDVQDKRR